MSDETRPADAPTAESYHVPRITAVAQVPGYEIIRELGRGGMGVVYQARHLALNRVVALKMILAGGHASPAELARFQAEAEAAARLTHPGIVQVYEVGSHDGLPWFALEFVPDGSLAQKLDRQPQPPRDAARLVEALARAVQHAHAHNIVHRDLKPANVLLSAGQPRVTDFGLAKNIDGGSDLTGTGAVMGTPAYMAPEQARGDSRHVGPADVWAMGVILYEMLTGQQPFTTDGVHQTLARVLADEPASPRKLTPSVPRDLETIALKCLRKEPGQRYASAGELADDLRRYLDGEPVRARPVTGVERTIKWVRRNVVVAGLLTLTVLALLIGVVVSSVLAVQANRAATEAEKRRLEAEEHDRQAVKQLTRAEWLVYAGHLRRAREEWEHGDPEQAFESLSACRWDFRGWEHDYLWTTFQQSQATLIGHRDAVRGVAVSPDGSLIVSGGEDGTVRVWDMDTGRQVSEFADAGPGAVRCVAISLDGKRIASAHRNLILVWNIGTSEPIRRLAGHTDRVNDLVFSADGRLFSTSNDRTVRGWNLDTAKESVEFPKLGNAGTCLAVSPDGKRLVSTGSSTAELPVWDTETGQEVFAFDRSRDRDLLSFSPDGKWLASVGSDRTVQIRDAVTGKETNTFRTTHPIRSLTFSPDGTRLIAGGADKAVTVWDARTGQWLKTFKGHTKLVHRVACSPDGRLVVSCSDDRTVKVWNIQETQGITAPPIEGSFLRNSLAINSNGREVLRADYEGVHILEARTGRELARLRDPNQPLVHNVVISPDDSRIAHACSPFGDAGEHAVQVWDAPARKLLRTLRGPTEAIKSVALSRDGEWVASSDEAETVRVWSVRTGEVVFQATSDQPGDEFEALAITNDRRLIAGGGYHQLKVWDLTTGKALHTLDGHTSTITCLALSPDDRWIVTGSADETMRVWEADTGRMVRTLQGQAGLVQVAVSPDGRQIISADASHTTGDVRVWDLQTGQELLRVLRREQGVSSFAISADGKWFATKGMFSDIRLHDVSLHQEPRVLMGHRFAVLGLAVTADGERLLSRSADGPFKVWNLHTGQEIIDATDRQPTGDAKQVTTPDGRLRIEADGPTIRVTDTMRPARDLARERLSAWTRPDPAYHRRSAEAAEKVGQHFALVFHLQRLLESKPEDADAVRRRLDVARTKVKE